MQHLCGLSTPAFCLQCRDRSPAEQSFCLAACRLGLGLGVILSESRSVKSLRDSVKSLSCSDRGLQLPIGPSRPRTGPGETPSQQRPWQALTRSRCQSPRTGFRRQAGGSWSHCDMRPSRGRHGDTARRGCCWYGPARALTAMAALPVRVDLSFAVSSPSH